MTRQVKMFVGYPDGTWDTRIIEIDARWTNRLTIEEEAWEEMGRQLREQGVAAVFWGVYNIQEVVNHAREDSRRGD